MSVPAAASFTCDSMVRGYHVYQDTWQAVLGEILQCRRETNNRRDPFAVAVMKNGTVVGHLPRKISALCSLFLRRRGEITCTVTGSRRYSADLAQGGLEIPCCLTFTGENDALVTKTKKLLEHVSSMTIDDANVPYISPKSVEDVEKPPSSKKQKADVSQPGVDLTLHDDDPQDSSSHLTSDADDTELQWLTVDNIVLTMCDRENILKPDWRLHDKVINSAQFMLKKQFPLINGFYSTFLLSTMKPADQWIKNFIQICHCQSNHWVTVSTIGCQVGEIQGYIMKQTKKQSLHSKDYLDKRN